MESEASSSWSEAAVGRPPSPTKLSDFVPNFLGRSKVQRYQNPEKHTTRTTESAGVTFAAVAASSQSVATAFEDPHFAAMNELCGLFPKVSLDEVERIFTLYEGDLEFCASALGEFDFATVDFVEMEQALSKSTALPQPAASGNDWSSEDEYVAADYAHSLPYQRRNYATHRRSSCSKDEDSTTEWNKGAEYFEMVLPADFATRLLTTYGHPDDESRTVSEDELKIKISPETAFELYKSLYMNMHRASEAMKDTTTTTTAASASSSSSDDVAGGSYGSTSPASASKYDDYNEVELAKSIREMETETSSSDPNLASIMKIETKLVCQMQEILKKYSAPNRSMAQRIHFHHLKQRYSHLDADFIDEIYCQYQLDIDKTEDFLTQMYGHGPVQSNPKFQAPISAETSGNSKKGWSLKYNPKDIKDYSVNQIEDLKSLIGEKWQQHLQAREKSRYYYQKFVSERDPRIGAVYYSDAERLSNLAHYYFEESQYYTAINQNVNQNCDNNLDLHGLCRPAALRVLQEFLEFKEEEFLTARIRKMRLLIITGQGKHSRNSIPVLHPEVGKYLNEKNYIAKIKMPGTYTVTLTRDSLARRK
ncbi:unnamed protein product [Orchesella dallaii]|uniref:Smr domain-containing protein n=1 Tax=Orchesella dallaii TaxID=48710 RepID=A0ABP1RSU9_9HEXA